jgi:hypothetical protein
VVADEPTEKLVKIGARFVRHARPLRHLPDGRGRGADATKTYPNVGPEMARCVSTTGGVCLNDEQKSHIGVSAMVRSSGRRMRHGRRILAYVECNKPLSFTPTLSQLGNAGLDDIATGFSGFCMVS